MRNRLLAVLVLLCAGAGMLSTPALASSSEPRPGWMVTAHTIPTYLPPGGKGAFEVRVINDGAADSTGSVTVTDTLPPGVTAIQAGAFYRFRGESHSVFDGISFAPKAWDCSGNGPEEQVHGATVVTCVNDPVIMPHFRAGGGVPTAGSTEPAWAAKLAIEVAAPGATGAIAQPNLVRVVGGGALEAAEASDQVTVSSGTPPFGFAGTDVWFSNANGTPDTQAGSHPYEASFVFDLNNTGDGYPASAQVRNLTVNLPPGFVGNPTAVPQCSLPEFQGENCPPDTQVGLVSPSILGDGQLGYEEQSINPVYNLVPPPDKPAEFAFTIDGNNDFLVAQVRSGSDYGLTTVLNNVTDTEVVSSVFTLWGDPSESSHDPWRLERPAGSAEYNFGVHVPFDPTPFLTLPTGCSASLPVEFSANSWEDPEALPIVSNTLFEGPDHQAVGVTGCGALGFSPKISTSPSTAATDTATGLTVEVKPPVGGLSTMEGLSTSDLKDTAVTLPEGVVINPGQAAGLVACTAVQSRVGDGQDDAPECPLASKIGVDEIETPLLHGTLKGNVYILQSNPPHLEMLVAASGEGVNLKLVGEVSLNESTGRLVTTFKNTPELPFTDFKLSFSGGAQAALDTPTHCGSYVSNADFTSWATPMVEDFLTDGSFSLSEGPGSSGCPGAVLPFAPELSAGATTDKAGGFSGFTMLLSRGDGQQRIEKLSFRMPAGLAGMISSVPVCGEPQAAQGTCPASTKIGHTVVTSGPGPFPLVVPQPGDPEAAIYLTGPYKGAPFGLSIVTPVIAGPFNLGTVVTRAKIEVDPSTAQITVATDALPQIVAGVPTDLRSVYAVIDRPGFLFNPTNCESQTISGTAWSTAAPGQSEPAQTAGLSSHFGIGSCRELAFAPKLTVATSGKTSKANGAGLQVKLVAPHEGPTAPGGSEEANLTRVKVDLPKQLPSRLTTLQQACTAAQFAANPAGCPVGSKIGTATVTTSVLPVPLTGPVIFVSHGGEAFPSLTMVLQGDNVTVEIVGTTFISHAGITSTTFKTVPDVPFSTFTLTLPQGKYSALAANGNLCKSKLAMPTEFLAQNGLKINQSTPIAVTGCPKPHKTRAKHQKKKHKAKK
jgi:uncharacterized repeat protein (TIGR01451 family)